MTEPPILELSGVTFGFANREEALLRSINLECHPGVIYGLYGPNGCGKTTLLNLITGLLDPMEGDIRYYGGRPPSRTPLAVSQFRSGLCRTFQLPVLVDELSVLENLLLAFRTSGETFSSLFCRPRSLRQGITDATARIDEDLKSLKLLPVRNQLAASLSYGTRRAISNLMALLTGAQIVLMDEPFANLEPNQLELHMDAIRREKVAGRAFVIVEHQPRHIARIADYLLWLHDGTLRLNKLEGEVDQKAQFLVSMWAENV